MEARWQRAASSRLKLKLTTAGPLRSSSPRDVLGWLLLKREAKACNRCQSTFTWPEGLALDGDLCSAYRPARVMFRMEQFPRVSKITAICRGPSAAFARSI